MGDFPYRVDPIIPLEKNTWTKASGRICHPGRLDGWCNIWLEPTI
jgi:hypothetical protein